MCTELIDFTNCDQDPLHDYGGSDRKDAILYDGIPHMIKFSEKKATRYQLDTSYVNNVISEYMGSHIFEALGIPVHQTLLGTLNDNLVVACRNFVGVNEIIHEYAWYLRRNYDSGEIGRLPEYSQFYEVLENDSYLSSIRQAAIDRYWDTFAVDALLGNFDRHKGNWGYIYNGSSGKIRCAPVYDNGSTLFPNLSEKQMEQVLSSEYELRKRTFVFPNAALIWHGRVGYYDMLSSGLDRNCSAALLRMASRIDLAKIESAIDAMPLNTPLRKRFYLTMITRRKEQIIDRACELIRNNSYDPEARKRILSGQVLHEEDLVRQMAQEGLAVERLIV